MWWVLLIFLFWVDGFSADGSSRSCEWVNGIFFGGSMKFINYIMVRWWWSASTTTFFLATPLAVWEMGWPSWTHEEGGQFVDSRLLTSRVVFFFFFFFMFFLLYKNWCCSKYYYWQQQKHQLWCMRQQLLLLLKNVIGVHGYKTHCWFS